MSLLEYQNISKSFPGVKALTGVNFKVDAGTVHGLIGENGAGKSTLMKILGGMYTPETGSLLIDGVSQQFDNSRDSIAAGVAIIHQELQFIPEMSVTENLLLGHMPQRFGFVKKTEAEKWALENLQKLGVQIDPKTKLKTLSIAEQQMIEICKAVLRDAKIIALDEPTSSLSLRETEILFRIIRKLKSEDKALVYISHRMDEIFILCDACTVLRDGRNVALHQNMQNLTREQLVHDMVGREIHDIYHYRPRTIGKVGLQVRNVVGKKLKKPASITVRQGEIVGLFGLVGAGRSELMRLIYSADLRMGGEVRIDDQLLPTGIQSAITSGLVFCPEDRKKDGIIGCRSVSENINISCRRHSLWGKVFIQSKVERKTTDHFIKRLAIRTPSPEQLIRNLSGGNQQKVILSRWLAEKSIKILIIDEPTRGIDVGAKNEIYQVLYQLAAEGTAILMVSSELPEILGVADRIIVMREGQISGELTRANANETAVLQLALPDASYLGKLCTTPTHPKSIRQSRHETTKPKPI